MEHNFWIERWQNKQIGFHNSDFHPLLTKHFQSLNYQENQTVFVPLCGKSLDMKWLLGQRLNVIGIELVESAVLEFFEELKIQPQVSSNAHFKIYEIPNLKIYVGDIFKLQSADLKNVNYIFDRGSMVALPEEMRIDYANLLKEITPLAKHFLITFEYDQSKISGPPFSLSLDEIKKHYSQYKIEVLESVHLENGMKGVTSATENVLLVTP